MRTEECFCRRRTKLRYRLRHWLLRHKLFYPDYSPHGEEAFLLPLGDGSRNLKAFLLHVDFPVIITSQDIDDIMHAALEGGIAYWCTRVEVVGACLGNCASEQISHGGTLRLYDTTVISDTEYDKLIQCYELTRERFLKGIHKFCMECGGVARDVSGRLDIRKIDAVAVDAIVQYAVFDEIMYS